MLEHFKIQISTFKEKGFDKTVVRESLYLHTLHTSVCPVQNCRGQTNFPQNLAQSGALFPVSYFPGFASQHTEHLTAKRYQPGWVLQSSRTPSIAMIRFLTDFLLNLLLLSAAVSHSFWRECVCACIVRIYKCKKICEPATFAKLWCLKRKKRFWTRSPAVPLWSFCGEPSEKEDDENNQDKIAALSLEEPRLFRCSSYHYVFSQPAASSCTVQRLQT